MHIYKNCGNAICNYIESHSSKQEKGRVCFIERKGQVQTLTMRINQCFRAGNPFKYGNNGIVQIQKSSIHFWIFLTSLKKSSHYMSGMEGIFVLLFQQYRIYMP